MTTTEAQTVVDAIRLATEPLHRRILALEAAAGIKAAPPPPRRLKGHHRGQWDRSVKYHKGDAVVWGSKLWLARLDGVAAAEPGVVSADYWAEANTR